MHTWKTVALQRRFGFPAQLWPRRLQFWDLLRCLRGNAAAALGFVWRSRPRDGAGALKTSFCFFFRYNVQATLHPLRVLLALLIRLWQTFGYLGLSLLTLGALFAMWRPPLKENGVERPRISLEVQYAFLAVIAVYVVAMAILVGALLARYLLPATPLVIIICISTLWRRARP